MRTSLATVAVALMLLILSALLATAAPSADAHSWTNDGYFGHECSGSFAKKTCWVNSAWKDGRHLHLYSHVHWGFHSHYVWCADSGWVCGAAF